MGYRDEHEALRARADSLARDLARQTEELAEGKAAKERASDLERALIRTRSKLAALEEKINPPPLARRARIALIVAGIAAALIGAVLVVIVSVARSPRPAIAVRPWVPPTPASRPVVALPPSSRPVEPAAPTPDLSAPHDRGAVQRVIRSHMRAVMLCYEHALVKNPGLAGKVVFSWTIERSGSVSSARLVSTTMGSPKVATCILRQLRDWRFPPPPDSYTVEYPFIFRPGT